MTKYELEQRLAEVMEQQRKLAVEAARLRKFLRQREEDEWNGISKTPEDNTD